MKGIWVPSLGMKPDLKPPSAMQGDAKLDCVRVWFFSKNRKMIVSLSWTPESAGGVYTREDPPTMTLSRLAFGINIQEKGCSQCARPWANSASQSLGQCPQT